MIDVSIIIVNYNASALLVEAVRSVVDLTKGVSYELIVVDNHSSDLSLLLDAQQTYNLRLIRLDDNLGFARANNEGIRVARGRHLFFLNPDTRLLNDAVSVLSHFLDANPEVGACGGNLSNAQGAEQFSYWPLLPGARMEWNELWSNLWLRLRHRSSLKFNHTGRPKEVGYIIGADLMTRAEVIRQVGPFSDDFFLFYEETELCYRIHRHGYKIISVPQAHICHLESQTIGSMLERQTYMMPSRQTYLNKTTSRLEHRLADAILTLNCLLRLLFFTLTANKQKQEFWRYRLRHVKVEKLKVES